jgi:Tfp pilus assembly PilM family ATPase
MTASSLVGNTFFGLDISQLGTQLMSLRRRLSKRLLLLEFSASGLRYAEAALSLDGIRFSHVSRVPLPEDALERGVPSDPVLMASLIKEICKEKGIPAHRAGVVLSPDVAYQRIIELPFDLTPEESRAYLSNPSNGVPLPFPLEQTDFDLYPLPHQQGSTRQSYLLIAIPQALIDRVVSLLNEAGFELQALELGPFSLLRFLADELIGLRESELHLVLELLPDCSQLCVVTSSGPIQFERLSAIRDFPDPELDDLQRKEALEAGFSAEELTLKDERYLPISELDLRAVIRDVKALISERTAKLDSTVVRGLSLSGINSAHPLIKDLFEEALGCDVKLISPILMPRVSGFSPDDLLVQAGLARLIGLGLGFLPREQLLSCNLPEISPVSLRLAPLPSLAVESIVDVQEHSSRPPMDPVDVEVIQIAKADVGKVSLPMIDRDGTSSKMELVKVEEVEEVEDEVESEGEEEWPSLGLSLGVKEEAEKVKEVEEVEDEVESEGEEEWPSLGLSLGVKEEAEKVKEVEEVEDEVESEGEEESLSINAIPGLQVSEQKLQPEQAQPSSQAKPAADESSVSSSLGELRFQDE